MEIRDDVKEGFEKKLRKEPTCVFYDAIKIISIVIQTDVNIIAYGDHGEGLRWAKTLQRDAKEVLEICMKEKGA